MVSRMSAEPTALTQCSHPFWQLTPKLQESVKHLLSGADVPKITKYKAKVQTDWSFLFLEEVHFLFFFQKENKSTEHIKSSLVYRYGNTSSAFFFFFKDNIMSWFHWDTCKNFSQWLFCVFLHDFKYLKVTFQFNIQIFLLSYLRS